MKDLFLTLIVALALAGSPALAQAEENLLIAQQTHGAGDLDPAKLEPIFNALRQQTGPFPDDRNVDKWRELAEAGYAPAQLVLGAAYEFGKGVERDRQAAHSWLIRAAESGNTTALYNLGILSIADGNTRDAYRWSYIARNRGVGQIQEEAHLHSQLLALVNVPIHTDLEQRSGNDWIESFPENPDANLPADMEAAFARIRLPPEAMRAGWREKKQHMIQSVQDSLASREILEVRSAVTF